MNRMTFIKPSFPAPSELVEDYKKITKNNFYTNSGPFEKDFENKCCEYIGQGVSTSVVANATLGLMLALNAHIPRSSMKNEVIVQSFTFAASAEAIVWCGLKPVFIDIEEDTWQANLIQARKYLEVNSSNVGGILFCNTFGVGCKNINKWEELAREFEIPLIIDSAAGFGSKYSPNEKLGARGDCEIFSLHATKPFAIGEGGLVVSKNSNFIETINQKKNFGFNGSREVESLGLNAKAPEISSAIGLRQLKKYNIKLEKRQESLNKFKKMTSSSGLIFQDNDYLSTIPFITIKLPKVLKDETMKSFAKEFIDVRDYYNPPVHMHPYFSHEKKLDLKITSMLCDTLISLPMHDDFTDQDLSRLSNALI